MEKFDHKFYMKSRDYGCFKYALFEDGYRFCHIETDHLQMKNSPEEKVISAGFLEFNEGSVRVPRGGSMTLKRGPNRDDEEKIAALLGCKIYSHVSF